MDLSLSQLNALRVFASDVYLFGVSALSVGWAVAVGLREWWKVNSGISSGLDELDILS
jgi:hypothetical protein